MIEDFSKVAPVDRRRIDAYVARLTDSQLDRLAAATPERAAEMLHLSPVRDGGLGFFWIIIQVAYMVYAAKQAKAKKDKAKKAAAAAAAAAKKQAAEEQKKIDAAKFSLSSLQSQGAAMAGGGPVPLPLAIGGLVIGLAGVWWLARRRRKG